MPKRRVASYGQERIFEAPPTHGKASRGPFADWVDTGGNLFHRGSGGEGRIFGRSKGPRRVELRRN